MSCLRLHQPCGGLPSALQHQCLRSLTFSARCGMIDSTLPVILRDASGSEVVFRTEECVQPFELFNMDCGAISWRFTATLLRTQGPGKDYAQGLPTTTLKRSINVGISICSIAMRDQEPFCHPRQCHHPHLGRITIHVLFITVHRV